MRFPHTSSYLPCTFFAVNLFFMDGSVYSTDRQWRTQEFCSGGGVKSQLRTGDMGLGEVAPKEGVL